MRVTFNHSQKTSGLFKKTTDYLLDINIELTEQEKAIIKRDGLLDQSVFNLPANHRSASVDPGGWDVSFGYLVKHPGIQWCFDTFPDAKVGEESILENLRVFKDYCESNADGGGSRTVEL